MIITFLNILLLSVNADYSWSLDRINQKYLIPDFHFFNTNYGYNTTVYVIDSGFTNNTLFYDNIILTESFIDDNSTDTLGHGTHVISLISSKDYGVSKNVDIVSLKVFNDTHNTTALDLVNALNFSQDHCMNHSNKCIINLSLGLTTIVEEVDDLLNDIYNDNFIIVVAAGNDDINSCLKSPSHLDFVITVGSINYFDFKSSFSNYGSCVDLYTYGELIPGLNLNNNILESLPDNFCSIYPNLQSFQVTNNLLCPPYLQCFDYIGAQNTVNCEKSFCPYGYLDLDGECYFEKDISILNDFISQNKTVHMYKSKQKLDLVSEYFLQNGG